MWALRRHGRKLALGGGAAWVVDQSALRAQEPAKTVPPFAIGKTRYDLERFSGRFWNMIDVIDPRMLSTTQAEIDRSKALIEEFKQDKTQSTASDDELWAARKMIDVCVHPVTGDTLFFLGRMSCFVPCNVPICVGMLSASSTKQQVFWQWINQSYNVMNNYVNRSSASVEWSAIGQAYGLACGVSMGMALCFGAVQAKVTALQRLGPVVPYTCVVLASSANIAFTRMDEILNGVKVMDKEGTEVGISKEAGKLAIQQTIMTRTVCLPILPILLPGLVSSALSNVITGRAGKIMLETVLVGSAFSVGLPVALAILPQQMEIDVAKLEPELQGKTLASGAPVTSVFANKGL